MIGHDPSVILRAAVLERRPEGSGRPRSFAPLSLTGLP